MNVADRDADSRLPDDLGRLVDLERTARPENLTVACYTFPHYHRSALNDHLYGPGWTEYVVMRGCRPWFPGHHQPRQPLLGELDEREPATWERYGALARRAGIDVFIWDWYWYRDGPALHEALDDGFLRASSSRSLSFAVMWTNHPWPIWYPTVHTDGSQSQPIVLDAPDEPATVWRSLSYAVARYFHLPTYWKLDGVPFLAIWEAQRLRDTFGIAGTRQLLAELRTFAHKLGHAGIHVHASGGSSEAYGDLVAMGFDSYGGYNDVYLAAKRRPPGEELLDYGVVSASVVRTVWPELDARSPLPWFPSVSPGWDASPRHVMTPRARDANRSAWPASAIVVDETPAAFHALVRAGLAFATKDPDAPHVLTVACWNEWTEGHYLLPDTRLGYGMLEALARALGRGVPPLPM